MVEFCDPELLGRIVSVVGEIRDGILVLVLELSGDVPTEWLFLLRVEVEHTDGLHKMLFCSVNVERSKGKVCLLLPESKRQIRRYFSVGKEPLPIKRVTLQRRQFLKKFPELEISRTDNRIF